MTSSSAPDTGALLGIAPPTRAHEHAWITRSRHRTSAGVVLYVRCVVCGGQRVDLITAGEAVPSGVSRELRTR